MKQKGFTLIELIVVIAIIGLLVTIGAVGYQSTLVKSRNTKAEADIQEIVKAMKLYHIENSVWPSGAGSANTASTLSHWQNDTGLYPTFLETIPVDPWGNVYRYDGRPDIECTLGSSGICSFGPNKTGDGSFNNGAVVEGDDICYFFPPEC